MREAVRRDIGGRPAQCLRGDEHRSFGNHRELFLEFARSLDAPAAGDERIVAARPVDGVGRGGSVERKEPVGGPRGRTPGFWSCGGRWLGACGLFTRRLFFGGGVAPPPRGQGCGSRGPPPPPPRVVPPPPRPR